MKFLDGKKFTETLIPGDKIRPKEGTKTYSQFRSKIFKDPVHTTTIVAMHPDGFDTLEGPYGMQEHSDDWELVKAVVDIKAKHTPGPWFAVEDTGTIYDFIIVLDPKNQPGNRGEGFIAGTYRLGEPSNNKENAQLIAAAPDLLHAVKSLLEYPAAIDGNPLYNEVVQRVRAQAAQAIAKAEGNL